MTLKNIFKTHPGRLAVTVVVFAAIGTAVLVSSSAAPNSPNDPDYPIADTNDDNTVDIFDLSYILSRWGSADQAADFNSDGVVSILDLSYLLAQWKRVDVNSPADPPPAPPPNAPYPAWVTFPGDEWQTITPEQAGFNSGWYSYIGSLRASAHEEGSYGIANNGKWGMAITRGGYLVDTVGDPDAIYQSASVGKALGYMLVLLAEQKGLIDANDPISLYWKGDGTDSDPLSEPRKYMTNGFNRSVTFKQLVQMRGGFSPSNGGTSDIDLFPEMYARSQPGAVYRYSSGGRWRLHQALTKVFGKDLKQVLDEEIFSKIGIPANRWDLLAGEDIFRNPGFYPVFDNSQSRSWSYYGRFIDPPYSIDGNAVRGGGGWMEMSAKDMARIGLLISTQGWWDGEEIIKPKLNDGTHFLVGHSGFGGSEMWGYDSYISYGQLRTQGTVSIQFAIRAVTQPIDLNRK